MDSLDCWRHHAWSPFTELPCLLGTHTPYWQHSLLGVHHCIVSVQSGALRETVRTAVAQVFLIFRRARFSCIQLLSVMLSEWAELGEGGPDLFLHCFWCFMLSFQKGYVCTCLSIMLVLPETHQSLLVPTAYKSEWSASKDTLLKQPNLFWKSVFPFQPWVQEHNSELLLLLLFNLRRLSEDFRSRGFWPVSVTLVLIQPWQMNLSLAFSRLLHYLKYGHF